MNIILKAIGWMHLLSFEIIAIVCGIAIGGTALILMIASKYQMTKMMMGQDTPGAVIVTMNPKITNRLTKQINIACIIAGISFFIALISIVIFGHYNSQAIKYGAFDKVQLSQTLNEIDKCTKYGFIEDSNIPEDLSGSIIIYFKYGCPDCISVHDDLMAYLMAHDTSNIYFVSSRSEKGKELLKKYAVPEVPSAVYVKLQESKVSDIYMEILYEKTQTETGELTTFNKDKLEFLIHRQIAKD